MDLSTAVDRATARFADVVRDRDWSAPAPTCPGTDVNRLVGHIGTLTGWAEAMIRASAAEPHSFSEAAAARPDGRDERMQWLEAALATTAKTLRATPDESPVWTMSPNGTARFWKRRLLHELAVHTVDIEIAYHVPIGPIDGAVARDGVDELLDLLPYAPRLNGQVGTGAPARLALMAGADHWHVDWAPPAFTWHRGTLHESADVQVTARSIQDLYLYAYGRPASWIQTRGDHDVLDRWRLATQL